MVSVAGVK